MQNYNAPMSLTQTTPSINKNTSPRSQIAAGRSCYRTANFVITTPADALPWQAEPHCECCYRLPNPYTACPPGCSAIPRRSVSKKRLFFLFCRRGFTCLLALVLRHRGATMKREQALNSIHQPDINIGGNNGGQGKRNADAHKIAVFHLVTLPAQDADACDIGGCADGG